MSVKKTYSKAPWSAKMNWLGTQMKFYDSAGNFIFAIKGTNILSDSECILNKVNTHDGLYEVIEIYQHTIEALLNKRKKIATKDYGAQTIKAMIKIAESIIKQEKTKMVEY